MWTFPTYSKASALELYGALVARGEPSGGWKRISITSSSLYLENAHNVCAWRFRNTCLHRRESSNRNTFLFPSLAAAFFSRGCTHTHLIRCVWCIPSHYRRSKPPQTPLGQEAGGGVFFPVRAEVKVEYKLFLQSWHILRLCCRPGRIKDSSRERCAAQRASSAARQRKNTENT